MGERLHPALAARIAAGSVLLVWPGPTARLLAGRDVACRWIVAARVLGVRHLGEAIAVNIRPSPAATRVGAAVDGIHALTALCFGLAFAADRRLTWINAITAAGFAAAGFDHARTLAREGG